MAGNNSLQILRGTSSQISNSNETLLDGQLLYDKTNNKLYIGNGEEPVKNATLVGGLVGPTGPKGPTGARGLTGSAGKDTLTVVRSFDSKFTVGTDYALNAGDFNRAVIVGETFSFVSNQNQIGTGKVISSTQWQCVDVVSTKGNTGAQGNVGPTGAKGDTGAAAGFGIITASVNLLPSTQQSTVSVTTSGSSTSKNFNFVFNLATIPAITRTYTMSDYYNESTWGSSTVSADSVPSSWTNNRASIDVNGTKASYKEDITIGKSPTSTVLNDSTAHSGYINAYLPSFMPDNNYLYKVNSSSIQLTFSNYGGGTGTQSFQIILQGKLADGEWEDISDKDAEVAIDDSYPYNMTFSDARYRYKDFRIYLYDGGSNEANININSINFQLEAQSS